MAYRFTSLISFIVEDIVDSMNKALENWDEECGQTQFAATMEAARNAAYGMILTQKEEEELEILHRLWFFNK